MVQQCQQRQQRQQDLKTSNKRTPSESECLELQLLGPWMMLTDTGCVYSSYICQTPLGGGILRPRTLCGKSLLRPCNVLLDLDSDNGQLAVDSRLQLCSVLLGSF